MATFGFISGLDDKPKQKYQLFEAELGFEKVSILVPFEQADAFDQEANKVKPKTPARLLKLASKFGGLSQ